jgi:Tol biopolymer transport system component
MYVKKHFLLKLLIVSVLIMMVNFAGTEREKQLFSVLEIYDLSTGEREVILKEKVHFEAPNWSKDGKYLLINSSGKLYRVDLNKRKREPVNTGFAGQCNNDHGFTPDGKQILISHHDNRVDLQGKEEWKNSRIFKLPASGGTPELITKEFPSFWHGISPDGKTLVYTAERKGIFNIYATDINGGREEQLTFTDVLDDGPDYSPDGKYIYYNSYASGKMQLWRMTAEGKDHTMITDDRYSNWFPHPNPNGKNLVYISYETDQGQKHPAMKKVSLKLFDLQSETIKTLCSFTGGQGTINVPSWSPDGKKFAFVSYGYFYR